MKSNIFDINSVELEVGQKVKFWNFYTNSGNSQDWFGTEPQNSFTVYEEYMEHVIGEIVFELGSFCVKTSSQIVSLRDYFNKTSKEIIDHFRCEWGGQFIDFIDDDQFFSQELIEIYMNLVENIKNMIFQQNLIHFLIIIMTKWSLNQMNGMNFGTNLVNLLTQKLNK